MLENAERAAIRSSSRQADCLRTVRGAVRDCQRGSAAARRLRIERNIDRAGSSGRDARSAVVGLIEVTGVGARPINAVNGESAGCSVI